MEEHDDAFQPAAAAKPRKPRAPRAARNSNEAAPFGGASSTRVAERPKDPRRRRWWAEVDFERAGEVVLQSESFLDVRPAE